MKHKEPYQPEWISARDAAAWLGVSEITLWRWRTSHGIAFTKVNGRTLCYDKKQLTEILNQNSTYAITGEKKLVV